MNTPDFPTPADRGMHPSPGFGISPVIYVVLVLLCWGWWMQREELSQLRSDVRQLSRPGNIGPISQDLQSRYAAQVNAIKAEQTTKEASLRQALARLDANDVAELKLLENEHQASRELAEFIASRNGRSKAEPVTPEWAQSFLSKDAFSHVTEVALRTKEPDSDLERLSQYPTIRFLEIGEGPLTPESIAYLQKLPRLTSLHFEGTNLTDADLLAASELTSLEKLTAHGTTLTNAGLAKLGQLRRLRELRLDGSTAITDEGLGHLAGLTELQTLDLHGAKITGAGFANLTSLPLEKLWLHGTLLDNDGLNQVVQLTTLKHLRIDNAKVTDAGLVLLKQLPNLRSVNPGRQASPSAVRRLGEALPKVHIDQ